MKKILYILAVVVVVATACTKNLSDLNKDPKNPSSAPSYAFVTNAERSFSNTLASSNVNLNIFRLIAQHWQETQYPEESQYDLGTREINDNIWNAIFEIGTPQGLKPIGLGARDTLRLEMGYCLYGNDIDDTTSPLEAGLGWITKFTKEFTAKNILEKQKTEGIKRKLVGFEMIDKGIPRHNYEIKDASGNKIGYVTSGTQSPSLQKAIGMGYVTVENGAIDSDIFVAVRDKSLKAKVVKLPFS